MYTLASDEKVTSIFAYTNDSLIRGDVITKQGVRVSTWLRTEAAPDFIHLYNTQSIGIAGSAVKPQAFAEAYLPTSLILGIHITPPAHDPLDYDEREANRTSAPMIFLMGKFTINGKLRVSTQTDFGTSLTNSRQKWLSIYDAMIHSPYLPQMPSIQVPMLVVRPMEICFCL
jgi:hypothetical protein